MYSGCSVEMTFWNLAVDLLVMIGRIDSTNVRFKKQIDAKDDVAFKIQYEGKHAPSFVPKIKTFINRILPYAPYLKHYSLGIDTSNSFPHSSGIASSASAMAALAAAIMDFEKQLYPSMTNDYQTKKCSFLARLGSGSAARSVQGPVVLWGEHADTPESSNLFGVRWIQGAEVYNTFRDSILLVDKGEKEVSSTVGHNLMHNHPFADSRFLQAKKNYKALLGVLQNGDMSGFTNIVEQEALSLHAMMLTSSPSYILMHPNTLEIIQRVRNFRNKTEFNLIFTLDAGANVHLLYHEDQSKYIVEFIESELGQFCQNKELIHDRVGMGLKKA